LEILPPHPAGFSAFWNTCCPYGIRDHSIFHRVIPSFTPCSSLTTNTRVHSPYFLAFFPIFIRSTALATIFDRSYPSAFIISACSLYSPVDLFSFYSPFLARSFASALPMIRWPLFSPLYFYIPPFFKALPPMLLRIVSFHLHNLSFCNHSTPLPALLIDSILSGILRRPSLYSLNFHSFLFPIFQTFCLIFIVTVVSAFWSRFLAFL